MVLAVFYLNCDTLPGSSVIGYRPLDVLSARNRFLSHSARFRERIYYQGLSKGAQCYYDDVINCFTFFKLSY